MYAHQSAQVTRMPDWNQINWDFVIFLFSQKLIFCSNLLHIQKRFPVFYSNSARQYSGGIIITHQLCVHWKIKNVIVVPKVLIDTNLGSWREYMPTPIFTHWISIDWFEHLNLATLSLWCVPVRLPPRGCSSNRCFEFTKKFLQQFDSLRTAAKYMQNQMLQYWMMHIEQTGLHTTLLYRACGVT